MSENQRLTPEELEYFKKLLLEERQRVCEDQQKLDEQNLKQTVESASGEGTHFSNHIGDAAAASYDREFSMNLAERQSKYLEQIDDALLRIKDGTYGICMVTGKRIPKERLEAVLVAKYSIEGKKIKNKSKFGQ
ncbi:MAG: TraR/DksA family transcriptional regulator [Fibrobacterota bacterium]|jgi:RNA polymerase-binding protein DksA